MKKAKPAEAAPTIVHPKTGGVYVRHDDKTVELESDYLARIAAENGEGVEEAEAEETADDEVQAPRKRGRKARR